MLIKTAQKSITEALKQVSDAPGIEAEIIISQVLGLSKEQLLLNNETELSDKQKEQINHIIQQRQNHTPLAYITGYKWFYANKFKVTRSTLIPRPETEILVELAINKLSNSKDQSLSMIDIGTGSGCISLSIINNTKANLKALAIDVSEEAIKVAKENASLLSLSNQIDFQVADIFDFSTSAKFDLIVSNPPYIPSNELTTLPPDILKFEPREALDGGIDGLLYYRRLASFITTNLKQSGTAFFEIHSTLLEKTKAVFEEYDLNLKTHNDLADKPRVLEVSK